MFFKRISTPFLVHFSIVLPLSYLHNLNALEFVGLNCSLAVTITFLTSVASFLYNYFLRARLGQNVDFKGMGSWAVVTGATDGIGFAYCQELAKRGINIVLMSRTLEKLYKCSAELQQQFGIETKVIQIDFAGDISIYEEIESLMQELDIGVLINNVGMTYSRPTQFHELPDSKKFIQDIININILAVTMMTQAVLPQMLRKNKGVIINVGSVASLQAVPWYALYGASKSYMDSMTDALDVEYEHTGIIFQYQYPGYVTTKLSKIKHADYTTPSPEQYAKLGMDSIGIHKRTAVWPVHMMAVYAVGLTYFIIPTTMHHIFKASMRSFFVFAKKRELEKLRVVSSTKLV